MAELSAAAVDLTPAPPPALGAQLRAVAWLRWRVLANGFRRRGGAGELLVRILVLPLLAVFALLPTAGAGAFGFMIAREGTWAQMAWVLWGIFVLTQVLNINFGQPGTAFDPLELIRFPMPLARWVLLRLCFGLFSPANILAGLMCAAVALGVTLAVPALFWPAAGAMAVFALTNVLFTRMALAWVSRWLATRRAREVFTALAFLFSLGIQVVNARFNPGFQHGPGHRHHGPLPGMRAVQMLHGTAPVFWGLPPGLAAHALGAAATGNLPRSLGFSFLDLGYAALFLAVYAFRMRTEFRGENLSDTASVSTLPAAKRSPRGPQPGPAVQEAPIAGRGWLPPSLPPLLGKELLLLRRNTGLFYGLVAPAVMVFLFAGRLSMRSGSSHWLLLTAVGYALLGVAPMSFNALGLEGAGAQLYFLAPVPLHEVFFAKNLFQIGIALTEAVLVIGVVSVVAGRPPAADVAFVLLWAVGTLLLSTAAGNRRSVAAPRIVKPGRPLRKSQSAASGYLSLALMLGCLALGFGCEVMAVLLHQLWLPPVLMLTLVGVAAAVYRQELGGLERYALDRREMLLEELGKKA